MRAQPPTREVWRPGDAPPSLALLLLLSLEPSLSHRPTPAAAMSNLHWMSHGLRRWREFHRSLQLSGCIDRAFVSNLLKLPLSLAFCYNQIESALGIL